MKKIKSFKMYFWASFGSFFLPILYIETLNIATDLAEIKKRKLDFGGHAEPLWAIILLILIIITGYNIYKGWNPK